MTNPEDLTTTQKNVIGLLFLQGWSPSLLLAGDAFMTKDGEMTEIRPNGETITFKI